MRKVVIVRGASGEDRDKELYRMGGGGGGFGGKKL
jgi:hypothetical protein